MADKKLKNQNPADETPEVSAADAIKALEELSGQAANPEETQSKAEEFKADMEQAAQTEEHAADALKNTVVRVSDDDAKEEKKYTKKELKELEKQRKALHKQYHISNLEIIRNYKNALIPG